MQILNWQGRLRILILRGQNTGAKYGILDRRRGTQILNQQGRLRIRSEENPLPTFRHTISVRKLRDPYQRILEHSPWFLSSVPYQSIFCYYSDYFLVTGYLSKDKTMGLNLTESTL